MFSKIFFPCLGMVLGILTLPLTAFPLKYLLLVFPGLALLAILAFSNVPINVSKFFLSLMILDIALVIDKHFFSDDEILSSVAGLQVSITTIALLVLYIIWWNHIITRKSKIVEFFPKMTIVALAYLLTSLSSMYNSQNISMTFLSIFVHAQMFLVYFYIANFIKSRDDMIYILNVLTICLFIQSSTIIIQYITRTHFNFVGDVSSGYILDYFHQGKTIDFYRPVGTGNDPTGAAGQIAVLLLITSSLFFYTKNLFKTILILSVSLMGIVALILTFSRGAWGSFTVGLIVFLFLALRHGWISGKKFAAMFVLMAIVFSVLSVPIIARLSQDDGGSAYSRVPLMKLAFGMIRDHPFIGVGANNFGIVLPQYLSPELRGEWLHLVHNQYLLILAETGIAGILFFLLIIVIVIHTGFRCIGSKDPLLSLLSIGIIASSITLLLFMTVELTITRLIVQLFWIMIAIAVASERLIRIKRQRFLNSSTV